MAVFTVNGKVVQSERDDERRLLNYLRFNLHLTSVKDGCSEGACGACTIIINGEATKACNLLTSEAEGLNILTVEGLSDREKEVFTYAFGVCGAVQCGFCIPGMVMCAKALFSKNLNPTEKDVRHAIRNNICRCTGYAKIVKAILLSASIFRGDISIENGPNWKIGERVQRIDVKDKVTGTGIYPDDIYVEGQLNAVAVRSKYPRAKVLSIDTNLALMVPDVIGVFTAEDIPGSRKVGHLKQDWDAIIGVGQVTRYLGDVIALVAAKTRQAAEKARDLVKVKYEVLPFVSSPYEAMKENAPKVHESGNLLGQTYVNRGDVEKAFKECAYIEEGHFSTPWTEHGFLEPECAFAFPTEKGVKIYSSDQGVYDTRRETAPMLGLKEEDVEVENCYVGGGFGGKEDVTVQHLSALVAYITKMPCKMKLSRAESIVVHPKRHPMEIDLKLGCDKDGKILALDAKVIADTGCYASLGLPVLQRACTHASGPYNYQNFRIDGKAYYTNNPPAGAFRGFGVTQTCFAIETLLNRMADKVGISHWDIRYLNGIRPGQVLPNGQIADSYTGLIETLEAVKEDFLSSPYAGIACAMKNAGVGVGLPDFGRVNLEVKSNAVIVHCGGSCIGQGVGTVLKQIVCDVTSVSPEQVEIEKANTFNAPDSGTTSGSRHTTVTGEAARRAAVLLKEALENSSLEELEGKSFFGEYLAKTDPFGSDVPNPKSHVAYGYATQVCILDESTHKVGKIVAAHDVGRAINPTNVEGQIEGGVIMGLGFAVREKYRIDNCVPLEKYGSLGLFRADEVPEIKPIIVEKAGLNVASGGIGIGEITSIPTAPAVTDAYYRLDGVLRNSLPLVNTPYQDLDVKGGRSKTRVLKTRKDVRCIGCMECVRECAKTFYKTEAQNKACIGINKKMGIGNQSGIEGIITRPVTCIQCGKCAKSCPVGAIKPNAFGVFIIDRKMCNNCGLCRDACPFDVMVENTTLNISSKCIACGKCVSSCPMGVLYIEEKSFLT